MAKEVLTLDVIVEGKITPEEPMSDVIETLADLKNFPHLVLRISAADADIEGRIAFSHGGYILGGRINNSAYSGYPAIQKLLSIRSGNYAILDPGRQQIADINQTLWILCDRVRERLPDLPNSPVGLFDADREHALERENAENAEEAGNKSASPEFGYGRLTEAVISQPIKSTIGDVKGKARSFNASVWFFIQWILILLLCLVLGTIFAMVWGMKTAVLKPPAKNSIEKLRQPAAKSPLMRANDAHHSD